VISKRALTTITLVSLMAMVVWFTSTSEAQIKEAYTPTGTTEYPWTSNFGHCTDKGAWQGWGYSPGPGPLTNHILWKVGGAGSPTFCYDGKVWAGSYCLDAATGDVVTKLQGSCRGTMGWIPKDIQQVEAYETWGFGPEVKLSGSGEAGIDKSDGYCYSSSATMSRASAWSARRVGSPRCSENLSNNWSSVRDQSYGRRR
jgi:hypothetical protein